MHKAKTHYAIALLTTFLSSGIILGQENQNEILFSKEIFSEIIKG